MRIAYVAGFFKHVHPELQKHLKDHLDSGTVVWIPTYGRTDELNVNRFKGDFLSAVSRGASEVLICLFFMRGKDYLLETVQAIIEEGKARSVGLVVSIELFESARDSAGVIAKIVAFGPKAAKSQTPNSLAALPQWVNDRHRDRIILHPRAVNSAKKSQFEDFELVFLAINLLGIEYWNMRTSTPENAMEHRERWEMKLKELGVEFSRLPLAIPCRRTGG